MHKGQKVQLVIEKLILGGEALARHEGLTVFVPYGAPGDRLEVELTEARKDYARAKILRILEPSPDRVEPPCPYFFKPESKNLFCGGCAWQHLSYPAQLRAKQELIREAFERIGKISVDVRPVLGMDNPWRYRNKVQVPFVQKGADFKAGFYAPSSHEPVEFDDCLVQTDLSNRIVQWVKGFMRRNRIQAYSERNESGWLRHLFVRTNSRGGALIALITRTLDFTRQREFVKELEERFPSVVEVHQNHNPKRTNVVLGTEERLIRRRKPFQETYSFGTFAVSPGSFLQVNHAQTEVLYRVVGDEVVRAGAKGVLDVYCGSGGIAFAMAKRVSWALGVEENEAAVHDAKENARALGARHVRFLAGRAEYVLPHLGAESFPGPWVGVVDPPRSGCQPGALHALVRLNPKTILYVSCDPATLARDAKILEGLGYKVRSCQPVDMFPQTAHIESVTVLERA